MTASEANYPEFIRNHARFLGFGVLMTFTSSAGQTYLIGVFGPGIQQSFNLSHTQWGLMYMVGTLSSSVVILWSGALIDRIDLRSYVAAAITGLTLACLVISAASAVWMVIVGIFLLRQFGQGLTSHAAVTTMARYFGPNRGKAIALASIGYSVGEAMLPVLAVVAIGVWGWRFSYGLVGLSVVLMLPILLWLLRSRKSGYWGPTVAEADPDLSQKHVLEPSRKQVLREWRFWLLMPGTLAPSLIMTALFFHHLNLADAKGWSGAWVTGSYWLYALASVVTSIAAGPLVDRLSAVRMVPVLLVPLAIGLIALAYGESRLWVLPYMFLMGITTGLYFTGLGALWAELYGTRHLGAIKALVGAFGILASALGPALVGILLDAAVNMDEICLGFAVSCMVATALLTYALSPSMARRYHGGVHPGQAH
jgi:MFS family permease